VAIDSDLFSCARYNGATRSMEWHLGVTYLHVGTKLPRRNSLAAAKRQVPHTERHPTLHGHLGEGNQAGTAHHNLFRINKGGLRFRRRSDGLLARADLYGSIDLRIRRGKELHRQNYEAKTQRTEPRWKKSTGSRRIAGRCKVRCKRLLELTPCRCKLLRIGIAAARNVSQATAQRSAA